MRFLLAILLFPFLLSAAEPDLAAPAKTDPPLQIRLIAENSAIAPGKPFLLGFHLIHPPGTHTYWKHPGIVGLPTTVQWELPPGFTAGEIQWPAPQVVKMGSHDAQGYEGETLLIIPITPPSTLTGPSVTLSAKASWMCCGKTCSPANDVPFFITLPVADSPQPNPATASLFQKFSPLVPNPDTGWRSSVARRGNEMILLLTPSLDRGVSGDLSKFHFFTADGQVDSSRPQNFKIQSSGAIEMVLQASSTAPGNQVELPGVVTFASGAGRQAIAVSPPY